MKRLLLIMVFAISFPAFAQQTQVIEYGYNARGELNMITRNNDTLINFYDASGNRITESQNIYAIDDLKDPRGDNFLHCYPNPTGGEITIAFELPKEMDYQISLYDQLGQFQKQIASGKNTAGKKEIRVSLANQPTGVYFIWFRNKEISKVKKIIKR